MSVEDQTLEETAVSSELLAIDTDLYKADKVRSFWRILKLDIGSRSVKVAGVLAK